MTPICHTVTRANRHDNTQTRPLVKRLGAHLKLTDEKIDHLYKNRMDCEHANFLLKEQLSLSDFCYAIRAKTIGREKVRVKVGITLIARLIQALHQLIHEKSPRTTIIN